MSGARLVLFLTGAVCLLIPAFAGVWNGSTVLGIVLMGWAAVNEIGARR